MATYFLFVSPPILLDSLFFHDTTTPTAGFGTWMSGVDINTQQSFEALNPRAVAVVVDPVQSVKGKVVLEAFRLINPQMAMMGKEPRQHTGNIGFMQKPSRFAIVQGLNRHYYQVCVAYKKNDMEMRMLSNLHQKHWSKGLSTGKFCCCLVLLLVVAGEGVAGVVVDVFWVFLTLCFFFFFLFRQRFCVPHHKECQSH